MGKMYPEEIKKFISNNYIGIESKELAEKINNTFGMCYTAGQIKSYKSNHKLTSGFNGRFEKGHMPENKGKKGQYAPGCEKGWFKKGRVSENHRPLGSERIDSKDGYTLVKIKEPNKWELKQHLVWREHYGNIPKGYKLIFLDCDNTNLNIDNLALLSNEELLIMNRNGLRYEDPKLTETGLLIAKVLKQKSKLAKRKKESLM